MSKPKTVRRFLAGMQRLRRATKHRETLIDLAILDLILLNLRSIVVH